MLSPIQKRFFSVFRSGYTLSGVVRKSRVSNFLNRQGHFFLPEMGWSQAQRFYLGLGQLFFEESFVTPSTFWFYPSKDLFLNSESENSSFSPWDSFYSSRWFGFSGANITEFKTVSELSLNESGYIASWLYQDDFYKNFFRHNVHAYKKSKIRGSSRELSERWRDLQLNLDTYSTLSWEDERLYKHKTHQASMIQSFVENVFVMKGFGFYDEENPPKMSWEQAYGELEEHKGPIPMTHRNYFDIEENQYADYQRGLVSEHRHHQLGFLNSQKSMDFLKRSVLLATDVERRISASSFQAIEYTQLDLIPRDRDALRHRHVSYLQFLFLWGQSISCFRNKVTSLFFLKSLVLLHTFRNTRTARLPVLSLQASSSVRVLSEAWLREAAQIFLVYRTQDRPNYLKRLFTHLVSRDFFRIASFCQKRNLRSLYSKNPRRWMRSWALFSFLLDSRSYTRWVYSLERSLLKKELLTSMNFLALSFSKTNFFYLQNFDEDFLGRFYWYVWFPSIFSLSQQLGLPYPKSTVEKVKLVCTPKPIFISYFSGSVSNKNVMRSSFRPSVQSAVFLPKEFRISKNRLARNNPFSYKTLVQELESRVHAQNSFARTWMWLSEIKHRFELLPETSALPLQISSVFHKFIAKDRFISVFAVAKRRLSVASYNQLVFRVKLVGQHRFTVNRISRDTFSFDLDDLRLYKSYKERADLLRTSLEPFRIYKKFLTSALIFKNVHRPWFFETKETADFCMHRCTFADDPNGWIFVKDSSYSVQKAHYTLFDFVPVTDSPILSNSTLPSPNPWFLTQKHFVHTQNKATRLRKLKQDLSYFKKYFTVYDTIKKFEHY